MLSSLRFHPVAQCLGLAPLETLGQKYLFLALSGRTVIRIKGAIIDLSENTFEILDALHGLDEIFPGQIWAAPLQALHHRFNESESGVEKDTPSLTFGRVFVMGLFVFHHEWKF